jgi:hypothetical protein
MIRERRTNEEVIVHHWTRTLWKLTCLTMWLNDKPNKWRWWSVFWVHRTVLDQVCVDDRVEEVVIYWVVHMWVLVIVTPVR